MRKINIKVTETFVHEVELVIGKDITAEEAIDLLALKDSEYYDGSDEYNLLYNQVSADYGEYEGYNNVSVTIED